MAKLYLECSAGISGDMAVAALLDAGADEMAVRDAVESLGLEGFSIEIGRVVKSGLDVCDFNVVLDDAHENHDHAMEWLFGGVAARLGADDAGHGHGHGVDSHPGHCHGRGALAAPERPGAHGHHHGHGPDGGCGTAHGGELEGGHQHRRLGDVLAIIDGARLGEGARRLAVDMFSILARAEGRVHGRPADEVHFHEVGALDSIVDIVALAAALDSLAPEEVIVPHLVEGTGSIRCQHGIIPVPAPAVVEIAQAARISLSLVNVEGELVTPTGAAFVAAARTSSVLPDEFRILSVGMGAGKRPYRETSGILRAFLIE